MTFQRQIDQLFDFAQPWIRHPFDSDLRDLELAGVSFTTKLPDREYALLRFFRKQVEELPIDEWHRLPGPLKWSGNVQVVEHIRLVATVEGKDLVLGLHTTSEGESMYYLMVGETRAEVPDLYLVPVEDAKLLDDPSRDTKELAEDLKDVAFGIISPLFDKIFERFRKAGLIRT